jgi:glycine/D-amino acid oxidase-like deaminating enzyme
VLVEKDALASGATGRSSALVRMHYTNEWEARLAWASFPVFRDWQDRMGGPAVFTRTGFLAVVAPPYAEHLRRNVQMLRGLGINTQVLTPEEVRELQPFMRVDDVGPRHGSQTAAMLARRTSWTGIVGGPKSWESRSSAGRRSLPSRGVVVG